MTIGRKQLYKTLLSLFVVLATCSITWAQATGSLVGTVTDNAGAVLPGARVTLTNLATNESQSALSNGYGNFQFLQLLPGNYKVVAEHPGFQAFVVPSAQVTVGNATRVDTTLQVGQATQTVEVDAQVALLDTQSSSLDYNVQSSQVEQLPLNGRNPINLAELVPGVVPQGDTTGNAGNNFMSAGAMNMFGNYQIGGGAANQSAIYVDGAPVNGNMSNSAMLVPNQDSIQEFQVATNNVSPEYGRFAGGVINMATKSGSNQLHGALYEYVRNAALNANSWFDNQQGLPRPLYTQNQFGAALGGPVIKNKAFFFLNWEEFNLSQATLINTQVPTPAMLTGDFSAVPTQLYDPNVTTCAPDGTGIGTYPAGSNRCAYTAANGYAGTNQIPASEINQAGLNISKLIFAPATNSANPATGDTNFALNVPVRTVTNQAVARGDQTFGKNKLFERYTNWHFNGAIAPMMPGSVNAGVYNEFGVDQAVVGDTITITPTMVADVRASFIRFFYPYLPTSCCNFDVAGKIGPGWSSIQAAETYPQAPTPNITGMQNYEWLDTATDTDESYTLSGDFTKTLGRHTITFGGEARRFIWDYVQSNSAGVTFNSPSVDGYTSSSMTSNDGTGYGIASVLLGYVTFAEAQEPARTNAADWYTGLYVNDSYRWTPKLTINAGLRWEQPGSFTETQGKEAAMLLDLPQPAVTAAMNNAGFSGTYTGGLGLINSSVYPHKDWQLLNWNDYSPRLGFAYSPTSTWVVRGGFGMSYLPSEAVAFGLGPFDSPINLATTEATSSGLTPTISLTNPFPNGVAAPASGPSALQADVNGLLGFGIDGPVPNHKDAYQLQWNFGFQKQFGSSASVNVGYVGSRGNHNPLFDINENQLPNQYDICGTDSSQAQCVNPEDGQHHLLTDMVTNPLSAANGGPIPTSAPLGAAQIQFGNLLEPHPQYQYMSAMSPNIGFTFYQALQVMAQKRIKGGILSAAWTFSNLVGTTESLTGWIEGGVFGAGGTGGVQDNTNIRGNASNPGEYARSIFQTPNRLIVNWVYPLPFGHGQRFLSSASGALDKIVGGWVVNGLSTFQDGFPIAFTDSSTNTLEQDFVQGGGIIGEGVGASRPNYVAGCNPKVSGKPSSKLNGWFNSACYTAPGPFEFGNEPRVDPNLRSQGIDSTDFSAAKDITFHERYKLDFRVEAFNLFNWTQFGAPNTQADNPGSFGHVYGQANQPRLIQFSSRFVF